VFSLAAALQGCWEVGWVLRAFPVENQPIERMERVLNFERSAAQADF